MLIFDASGNLYGTTFFGGKYSFGTAFKLTPQSGGGWAEKIVHAFGANNMESAPSRLIFDAAGNLYGTTQQDNNGGGGGTVFELSPKAAGGWTENVLHEFPFNPTQTEPRKSRHYQRWARSGRWGRFGIRSSSRSMKMGCGLSTSTWRTSACCLSAC